MGSRAGRIELDLDLNQSGFRRQLNNIMGTAKKAGLALAAAFSVKKLIDFGSSCVQLGSDLQEVQNVVDVTFPKMSAQVDSFAKNAMESFGLSETMAKKFTGTFGAMAKAFGFSEKAAYEMSTTLTGLAGDVASFYNISQDEAYTKLKSVFSGETETLKDLGIVMTQSALDAYALANGYGKTTNAMSEMEKVALRYRFVQDQLTLASGDFIRTGDGWANQVRVLKLQFDSLKATIGQGLINVLTPVIKVINTIIGKLMSLANAFKAFTEMVTGKKSGGGAAAGMAEVADAADAAGAAVGGTGSAAKKAAKELKGVTTGIDELNVIKQPEASGGAGSGAGGGGYSADTFDMGSVDTSAVDEMDGRFRKLIERFRELAGLVKQGFWDGFGDTSVFDSIQNHVAGIRTSLKDIFTSPEVTAAANRFADTFVYNLGKVAGSMASVGATVADNLLGGLDLCLAQNAPRIKEYLVSMFDIGSGISEIAGNFSSAVAEIFSVFRSDSAKQISADLMGIFLEAFMGVTELLGKLVGDILNVLTKPIIDNKDEIKGAIQGLLDEIAPVIHNIKELLGKMFDSLNEAYDTYAKPVFENLAQALSDIVAWCLENKGAMEAVAAAVTLFFAAWELVTLGEFIINAGGVTAAIFQMIAPITAATAALLANAQAFFVNTAAKLVDKAETAAIVALYAKDFVVATAASVSALVQQAAQFAITTAAKIADTVAQIAMTAATVAWNAVCTVAAALTTAFGAAVAFLTSPIGLVVLAIAGLIAAAVLLYKNWDTVKEYAVKIWNEIKDGISNTVTRIKETVVNIFNTVKSSITAIMNNIMSGINTVLGKIKASWENIWTSVKTKTIEIFNGIWNGIKGAINNIIGGVEKMANSVIRGINSMINALNKLKFDVPDWVPEIGGKSFGLNIPTVPQISIPRLAQGGYVRANTPQLAMIGDNRRYGEIVSPEDKLQEMVDRAVLLSAQNGSLNERHLMAMADLLRRIIELIEHMDLTVRIDIRDIRDRLNELDSRSGYRLRKA